MPRAHPLLGRRRGARLVTAYLVAVLYLHLPAAANAAAPRTLHDLLRVSTSTPVSALLATPAAADRVALRARSRRCAARTPVTLRVFVDDRPAGRVKLRGARWRNVVIPHAIAGGTHRVSVYLRGARGCGQATVDELRLSSSHTPPPTDPLAAGATPLGPKRTIPLATAADWELSLRTDQAMDKTFLERFDGLTPENTMKMTYVEPRRNEFEWTYPDNLVKYVRDHGKTLRGHTLIWHKQLPGWLTERRWSRDEMLEVMREWIGGIVGHYKGKIVDWDVLNELFDAAGDWRTGSVWYESLGPDLAEQALRMAHDADPGARLFINDFDIERPGPKQDALYALVKDLKARGVPLDGVGIQGHWSISDIVPEAMLLATMRRFAALGVRIELTELDVTTDHEHDALQRQAEAYAMAGRVCQSLPECDRVTVWGISDRDSWRGAGERPLLFDDQFREKPAYAALRAALSAG